MESLDTYAAKQLEMLLRAGISHPGVKGTVQKYSQPYKELMAYYRCALMSIETKFNVLNEELSLQYDRNPIESIKTRIKSPESLLKKMTRRNIPITVENIERNINDVAGARVVCSYTSDIYMLAESFASQDDINVVQKKDYIQSPKPNGYRSLHLIVETPIFLHDTKKLMKVEVQFRTISMDFWASLEHKIRYKKDYSDSREIEKELFECAQISAMLDSRMEKLQEKADCVRRGKLI